MTVEIAREEEPPITREEIYRFFAERVDPLKCEVCQTVQWRLLRPGDGYQYGHFVANPSLTGQIQYVPMISISCAECGNIKSFLQSRVKEWLGEHDGK